MLAVVTQKRDSSSDSAGDAQYAQKYRQLPSPRPASTKPDHRLSSRPDAAKPSVVYRSVSRATPSAKLIPTWPSTDSGCREIVRWDPPTSSLAPRPRPNDALPLAPT
jgi:hypothetical protein